MREAQLDKYEQAILNDVNRVGWSLVSIKDRPPRFVYSVGMMHTLNHPEIIIFGLSNSLMGRLINGMGKSIRNGCRYEAAGLYEGLLEGISCKIISVAPRYHEVYLGYAMWHRRFVGRIGSLRAVQCLWPDKEGRFADDPNSHSNDVSRQPLLVE